MKRILVIGCPGSGKSTFSKQLSKALKYPVLHLDRIFHIDNKNQISRNLLKTKIQSFINDNNEYIIDGNYSGTLEYRLQSADTVFYFNIDLEICVNNAINRCNNNIIRDDIASGFDNSIIDPEFIDYIKNFNINSKPRIEEILANFKGRITRLNNYQEVDSCLESIIRN
ncbi:MAG: AAA family ATPase [Tenericutes bacterium]|nr:AAA family ATPase [Mycoplasmatota bacterium]